MNHPKNSILMCALLGVMVAGQTMAATLRYRLSGDYNDLYSITLLNGWDPDGTGPGGLPGSADTIRVNWGNNTVTLTNVASDFARFQLGVDESGTLVVESGGSLAAIGTSANTRWYSSWAPGWLKAALRPIWPDRSRITFEELTGEMNRRMQFPGWTNAYSMPIRARVDMLTTGLRTPVGVKVLGTSLDEIEKVGLKLEQLLTPVRGTRSVYYERNTGGLYLDIVPDREALARYGLTVGDLQRTIEAAIGGAPIGVTIEGRSRFSINVRYPRDLRSDLERLRRVLVPVTGKGGGGGGIIIDFFIWYIIICLARTSKHLPCFTFI